MDFATLQSTLLARLNMGSVDPLSDSAASLVNEAIHFVETMQPNGWPWARRTVDITTVADTAAYSFDTDILSGDYPAQKILEVKILQGGLYTVLPLLSREEADDIYALNQSQIPACWFAEGQSLHLTPTPDDAYTVRIRAVFGEVDLQEATDLPLIPATYHTAIISAGLFLYYQSLQDVARATAVSAQLDQYFARVLRHAREYSSAPRVQVREF